jgi:hypothetical protein
VYFVKSTNEIHALSQARPCNELMNSALDVLSALRPADRSRGARPAGAALHCGRWPQPGLRRWPRPATLRLRNPPDHATAAAVEGRRRCVVAGRRRGRPDPDALQQHRPPRRRQRRHRPCGGAFAGWAGRLRRRHLRSALIAAADRPASPPHARSLWFQRYLRPAAAVSFARGLRQAVDQRPPPAPALHYGVGATQRGRPVGPLRTAVDPAAAARPQPLRCVHGTAWRQQSG